MRAIRRKAPHLQFTIRNLPFAILFGHGPLVKTEKIPFLNLDSGQRSFRIRPILRTINPESHDEPPHRHNYQELIWIRDGGGHHRIDETHLAIQPNTFYLIAQGQVHHFEEGVELDGWVIRFTDDFLLDHAPTLNWDYRMTLFGHFAVHRSLTIGPPQLVRCEALMQMLAEEMGGNGFGRISLLRHLLSMLLVELERARLERSEDSADLSPNADLYQQFLTNLDKDFKQQHHVSHYAGQLAVTPRQLSDVCSRFSGKTAKQIIQDRLMLEARRYLQHTNSSIKEIAWQLGYREPSYFSKVFKNTVGVSPNAYKVDL